MVASRLPDWCIFIAVLCQSYYFRENLVDGRLSSTQCCNIAVPSDFPLHTLFLDHHWRCVLGGAAKWRMLC